MEQINTLQVEYLKSTVIQYLTTSIDSIYIAERNEIYGMLCDLEIKRGDVFTEYNTFVYSKFEEWLIKRGCKADGRDCISDKWHQLDTQCKRMRHDYNIIARPTILVYADINDDIGKLILDGYDVPLSTHLADFKARIDDAVRSYKKLG